MDISKNYPLGLSPGLGISFDEPPPDNTTTPDWLSRRDAAILRSPYTVTEASEYHEPAILRVWGIVTCTGSAQRNEDGQEKLDYVVHIQSHDDAENVDLLQPYWFESRQTVRYPSVTFSEARRHREYQLNRLSNHDDWRPIGRVVKVLLEPEPGTKRIVPICFCLFDETHIPGIIVDDTDVIVEMVDKDNGKVTHQAMIDGFERYLDRLREQNPEVIAYPRRIPSTDVERQLAGQAAHCPVAPIRRGRYRRRMRRHGGIGLQAEIKEGSRTMSPLEQPKYTVIPSQITSNSSRSVVRGRRRRQSKRHGLGLSQVEASLNASSQATVGSERGIAVAVSARPSSDILSYLPGGSRLNPEAFSFLTDKLPVVWLQVRDPDKFDSELLILPIYHDDGDERLVGRLIVPKKSVQVWEGQSWAQHIASNEADFGVEKLFVLDGSRSSHESAHYWDKFLPEAFDDYTYGLWSSTWAGDVELALQASMQTPPLVFPDLIPGALANTREHLKIWSALSTDLDKLRGLETSRFLAWNTDLAKKWHYERLVELKTLHDKGLSEIEKSLAERWSASYETQLNLPDQGPVDIGVFRNSQFQFAQQLQEIEIRPEKGRYSKTAAEEPKPLGHFWAYNDDVDYFTREFFYGSRYFPAIPQAYQEQTVERIVKLAADESRPVPLRAHATLELGICLLSGFGIDQDIREGLRLVIRAANGGSRQARAVIGRLPWSYGSSVKHPPHGWLIDEVVARSYWAIEELKRVNTRLYDETLKNVVFSQATMTSDLSRFDLDYIEKNIKPRYNFSDPNALREQIKKDFGPAEDENRSTALDNLSGAASSSLPGFFAQTWPESPPVLWSVAAEGGNALGLLPSFAQPPTQPRTPQPFRDEETDALGLFTPEPEETHQTSEICLSGFSSPLVPEPPASSSGEVNKDNPLDLFTPKVEGASTQTWNSSIEDVDSPSPPDNLGKNVVGPQTPAFGWEVPTRSTMRPFVPKTLGSSGYLQLEHTITERQKVNEDIEVADERQLRPSEFFDLAIRFLCCYGPLETLHVLIQEQPRLAPDLTLEIYISVALAAGNGDMALALLDSGAEISQKNNPYLLYQLHHLPAQQVEPVARAIVSKGFDPNEKVELHKDTRFARDRLSVFLDHVKILYSRSEPEFGDYFRHWSPEVRGRSITPLRWALYHGNEIVVKVLLDLGAEFARLPDVDTCVAHGGPVDRLETETFTVAALEEPCFNMNILEMFFRRHGNQLGKAVFAETPLGLIAMEPDCPERRLRFYGVRGEIENLHQVLSLLRKYQPDSDAQLFWAAAMNGHEDIVRYLIEEGVDIETRYNGQTPLHTAVLHGQKGVFRLLVKSGANVHAVTSDRGMSLMHLLFWKPKPVGTELFMIDELHRLLGSVTCDSGAFSKRVQPIHLAALNSRVVAVGRLLELGADPTIPIEEDIMPSIRGCCRHAGWEIPGALKQAPFEEIRGWESPVSVKGLTPAGIILVRCDMFSPVDLLAMLSMLVLSPSFPISLSRLYTRPALKQTIFHLLACHFPLTETGILEHLLHRLPAQLSGLSEAGSPPPLLINLPDADGDTPLHYAALFGGARNTRAVDRLLAIGADSTARNARGMVPGVMRARYFAWKGAAALRAAAAGKGRGEGDGGIINDDRDSDGGRWGRKYVQLLPMERFAAATSSPAGAEGVSCSSDVGRDGQWEQEHDGGKGDQSVGGPPTTTYRDGNTAPCMRPREFGDVDGEGNEVKTMGQLLHGARVREVWDLHAGRWVRFEREMVVHLVTEADMRTDFAKKDVID